MTHEEFIQAVRDVVASRTEAVVLRTRLMATKLVYGAGTGGARGVTYREAWTSGRRHDFVEICASGEESPLQLAGTTLHELGHVAAGYGAGHGPAWKRACLQFGLSRAIAAGQVYSPEDFVPVVWKEITGIAAPTDGQPAFHATRPLHVCTFAIGSRGGMSRGRGTGSRLRLHVCECPVRVRVAADTFEATCHTCGTAFKRVVPLAEVSTPVSMEGPDVADPSDQEIDATGASIRAALLLDRTHRAGRA